MNTFRRQLNAQNMHLPLRREVKHGAWSRSRGRAVGKREKERKKVNSMLRFIKITNNKNVVEMQQIMVFRLRF